jgi:putative hydrolase of the HAD superfamily
MVDSLGQYMECVCAGELDVRDDPLMVRTLLLDLDGVLKVPDEAWIRQQLGRIGVTADPVRVRRAHYRAIQAFDAAAVMPHLDAYRSTYPTAFIDALDLTDASRAQALRVTFRGSAVGRSTPLPSSIEAVTTLATAGVVVAVVTNNSTPGALSWLDAAGLACSPSGGPLRAVVESSVVGVAKPDPRIIHVALQHAGQTDPASAVFVGDSLRLDGKAAEGAGVLFAHFDPESICASTAHHHLTGLADPQLSDLLAA